MIRFPRMQKRKNGGPLAKEWLRHLPQPQSYESFRTPKCLSKASASGGAFHAVMSVEAALSFSLFLLLISLFFTFYQEQAIALRAQRALDETAEAIAEWSYALSFAEEYTGTDLMSIAEGSEVSSLFDGSGLLGILGGKTDLMQEVKAFLREQASAVLWQAAVKGIVAEKIGADRLQAAGVEGGANGLSLSGSTLHDRELDLMLSFRVASRTGFPFRLNIPVTVRSCRRLWTGTLSLKPDADEGDDGQEEAVVYVTATGTVYHRSLACRVLNIRPAAVPANEVGELRNSGGGKYYPCDYCCRGKTVREGMVYITDDGSRYHADRDCGEITRYVRKMALSEAQGKYPPCRFCGEEAG